MPALAGQRVLLVAPRFFGYEQDILRELVARGAHVDHLPDRPFESATLKAALRVAPAAVIPWSDRIHRRQLARWGTGGYDLVLVVNGQSLSRRLLRELRAASPRARFILYLWDSLENRRGVARNLSLFDRCLSFDPDCARSFGLHFRPLFFAPDFAAEPARDFAYHLSFVGTAHTDRFALVSAIAASLPSHQVFYRYLYLQAPWVFPLLKATRPSFRSARRSDFRFDPLPRAEVRRIFFGSRAIFDIEHPRQAGLTIRTIEALGAMRKLVTTNPRVREYDFFRPANICVVDRRSPAVPADFLDRPYEPLPSDLYRRYSLAGWMDEVLAVSANP